MNLILPHSHFDQKHLEEVISEMKIKGVPIIKAVDTGEGVWVALEGSHRIRAAKALGLVPVIEEIEYSEDLMTDDVIPGQYQDNWTIAEIVDKAYQSEIIEFEN